MLTDAGSSAFSQVDGDARLRETIAIRIIELARRGELDPASFRNQIVAEATGDARASMDEAVKRGDLPLSPAPETS
jgi:hypothetical protein